MIHIDNLSVSYGPAKVIQFPEWQLPQGGHSLILGRSGTGKTTLLHVLSALLRPSGGRALVAGADLAQLSGRAADQFRGRNLGLIFQQPHLLDALTVADNLRAAQYFAGLPQDPHRIDQVLTELNLAAKKNHKPYELSQGEQQRAAIARAMLNQPKVILADEPTSSLDDDNCNAVIGLLLDQASRHGASLVIATHDQRLKDRIAAQLDLSVAQPPGNRP
jgi:putative ABC transport system ATP-binding protein